MSHHQADRSHLLRREIERALQQRFPTAYIPLYAMVSFSTLPYAEVVARGTAHAAILDRLLPALGDIGDLNLDQEWLTAILSR